MHPRLSPAFGRSVTKTNSDSALGPLPEVKYLTQEEQRGIAEPDKDASVATVWGVAPFELKTLGGPYPRRWRWAAFGPSPGTREAIIMIIQSSPRINSPAKRVWAAVSILALLLFTGCARGDLEDTDTPSATAHSYDEYDTLFADWAPRYADCVREAGGNPRIVGNSIENAVVPGRAVDGGLDLQCLQAVGAPPEAPTLTDEFLGGLYELYVEQAECLEMASWSIPAPPSRQEWVENYGGESWAPLVELMKQGEDVAQAQEQCPQPTPNEAERTGRQLRG